MGILKRSDTDSMRAEHVMTSDVVTCGSHDTLNRAAQLMWERDCGIVPVVDGDRVVGMITDRDCCMAAYTQGRRLDEIPVWEAMSVDVKSCGADEPVADVEARMSAYQIRRMPVVRDEKLVGIISMNDLALAVERGMAEPEEVVETLAHICHHRRVVVGPGTDGELTAGVAPPSADAGP